jgi:hypothetical protein
MPFDDDFLKAWGAHQEGALNADTITGNPAYSEVTIITTASDAQDNPSKFLCTLIIAFFDSQVNPHGIAWSHFLDIWIVWSLNGCQILFIHFSHSLPSFKII